MPIVPDREADLHPDFPIPPNVVGLTTLNLDDATTNIGLFEGGVDEPDLEQPDTGIPVPDSITVIQQQVKFSTDGTYLVDVIIDIELPGYEEFEVRASKV